MSWTLSWYLQSCRLVRRCLASAGLRFGGSASAISPGRSPPALVRGSRGELSAFNPWRHDRGPTRWISTERPARTAVREKSEGSVSNFRTTVSRHLDPPGKLQEKRFKSASKSPVFGKGAGLRSAFAMAASVRSEGSPQGRRAARSTRLGKRRRRRNLASNIEPPKLPWQPRFERTC